MARRGYVPRPRSLKDQVQTNQKWAAFYSRDGAAPPLPASIASLGEPKRAYTKRVKPAGELSELQEQIRVVQWWDKHCAEYELPPYALFAIPNGAALSSHYGSANLKRSGMRAGIEDLFLAHPKGKYHGLFIEMKRHDGSASDEQMAVSHYHLKQGYQWAIAYGHEEAIQDILDYLIPF